MLAHSFFARLKGLQFVKDWPAQQALWISHCNCIHTGFMRFAIDVIFVNKDLKVVSVYKNITPWNLTLPQSGASSVFEFKTPYLDTLNLSIKKGEQLHVVD